MRVYVAAFGSGMGHASRMTALAKVLVSSGDRVMFSSSGEVTGWIRRSGFSCNDLPLVDVEFNEEGAFSATETLKHFPLIMARVIRQVRLEVANLRRFEPDVVLSDSVGSTIVASKLLGVRTVAVLNQIRLWSSPRTPPAIAGMLTAGSVAVGNALWDRCDDVLVPDLPPPYTISEKNVWGAGAVSSRVGYIGFLVPRRAEPPDLDGVLATWHAERKRRKVFWQISGPPATRGPFLAKTLEIAKALRDDYFFVITAGRPGGSTSPYQVPGGYMYQWCESTGAFIDSCDIVVSRAGHVSISEYILRAKPCLLVPIQAQMEQMGNASKLQRLGLALTLLEEEVDPQRVADSLRTLSSAGFAARGRELKSVAESYDAVGSILSALKRTRRRA